MSIINKLQRMKNHMKLVPTISNIPNENGFQACVIDERVMQEWQTIGGKVLPLDDQYSIVRQIEYPLSTKLGIHQLTELMEVTKRWNETLNLHPLSTNGLQSEQLLFFDTETTGLGGGTGNTIFLIGYCYIKGDVAVIKQHFLPDPAEEAAFYYHFLHDVGHLANLVTYNGKAFDWPQVRTRHTFVRERVPALPKFGHYDLLHGARRLWKNRLPSCRLSIVEKEILHLQRIDDTPGSLAPLLYFDYLKDKNPQTMTGVFKHNELDVLSLIVLYIHISKKLLNIYKGTSLEEKFEMARWFESVKEYRIAMKYYEEVANNQSPYKNESLVALGLLCKMERRLEDAIDCFYCASQSETNSAIKACIELAKLYEHQIKDIEKAIYYTTAAFDKQKKLGRFVKASKPVDEIKARLERLLKKQQKEAGKKE